MIKVRKRGNIYYIIVIQLFLFGCNNGHNNNNSLSYTTVPKEEYINYPDSG